MWSENYNPLIDPIYMSPRMLLYFEEKLVKMREDILHKEKSISLNLQDNAYKEIDYADESAREELLFNDFIFLEHEEQLLKEIEAALNRIKMGEYGYCDLTGKPIGIKRLQAKPSARLCVNAQEAQEEKERKKYKIDI